LGNLRHQRNLRISSDFDFVARLSTANWTEAREAIYDRLDGVRLELLLLNLIFMG
jgi:hypothetical protein